MTRTQNHHSYNTPVHIANPFNRNINTYESEKKKKTMSHIHSSHKSHIKRIEPGMEIQA